jgi:cellulase
MSEIKRLYVQGGKVIKNAAVNVWGSTTAYDSIVPGFCQASGHQTDGWHSLNQMAASFARGHVLVFSLWDSNDMGWLDGQGGEYGPCDNPSTASIEAAHPDMTLNISNIKFGDLDSTY